VSCRSTNPSCIASLEFPPFLRILREGRHFFVVSWWVWKLFIVGDPPNTKKKCAPKSNAKTSSCSVPPPRNRSFSDVMKMRNICVRIIIISRPSGIIVSQNSPVNKLAPKRVCGSTSHCCGCVDFSLRVQHTNRFAAENVTDHPASSGSYCSTNYARKNWDPCCTCALSPEGCKCAQAYSVKRLNWEWRGECHGELRIVRRRPRRPSLGAPKRGTFPLLLFHNFLHFILIIMRPEDERKKARASRKKQILRFLDPERSSG